MNDLSIDRAKTIDYEFECLYPAGDGNWQVTHQDYGTPQEKHFSDIDLEKIEIFRLNGKGRFYGVDLRNGEMNLNGTSLFFDLGVKALPNGENSRLIPKKYTLIYFRRIRNDFTPDGVIKRMIYCFGWQTDIDGESYQRIICVDEHGRLLVSNKK